MGVNVPLRLLSPSERPREKALRAGIKSLSDVEVLALIIGSGTKGASALAIANDLLEKHHGLYQLAKLEQPQEIRTLGLGATRALTLLAAFSLYQRIEAARRRQTTKIISTTDAVRLYQPKFASLAQETLVLVMLDGQKNIIQEQQLYQGTAELVDVNIREVLAALLKVNATYYLMIHNHPSGYHAPSLADRQLTLEIKDKAALVGLRFFDHIIFSHSGYYSFSESEFWDE